MFSMGKTQVKNKEYELAEKDEALIEVLKDLTMAIDRLRMSQ